MPAAARARTGPMRRIRAVTPRARATISVAAVATSAQCAAPTGWTPIASRNPFCHRSAARVAAPHSPIAAPTAPHRTGTDATGGVGRNLAPNARAAASSPRPHSTDTAVTTAWTTAGRGSSDGAEEMQTATVVAVVVATRGQATGDTYIER